MEADFESKSIKVDGLNIRYITAGERGSPVLLLHGGGTDSALLSWRLSIGRISQSHRVFAPDLPGYGESDKPKVKYTNEYYVDFLGKIMDALKLERASLVGISMGGGISLGFTLKSPERVDKLVLVDSYGLGREIPGGVRSYLLVHLPLLLEMAWMMERQSRWVARWSLRWIFYNPQTVTDELVDEIWQLMKKPGVGRAFASFQRSEVRWGGVNTDFVDRLHEITVATLILHGAEDSLVPVSWAERAHRLIKGSELHIFPECGHWPPREKTEEFNRVVLEFLAK